MNRSLAYAALAIIIVGLIAVALTQTGKDSPDTGMGPVADAKSLVTGQVANFTLSEQTKPTSAVEFFDSSGQARSFADFAGKVLLVNFWATWCAPCIREMPALARLEAELGGDDFRVVAISIDRQGMAAVNRFYKKHKITGLEPFVDTKNAVPRKLRVVGLPTTVLIDRRGQEIGRLVGGAEWDSPEAVKLIRHFIKASSGSRSSTRALLPILAEVVV